MTHNRRLHVQLLTFPGCPNAGAARKVLESALAAAGAPLGFEEVNVHDAATPEALRNWASPTILVNGKDVADGDSYEGTGCRIYQGKDNAPDLKTVVAALHAAMQSGDRGSGDQGI